MTSRQDEICLLTYLGTYYRVVFAYHVKEVTWTRNAALGSGISHATYVHLSLITGSFILFSCPASLRQSYKSTCCNGT
ncbi:hypothetical protein F4775DRAFT_555299 [Biscogniauxia sp. FL1348]|nr:hypothetical protein F4775DRAFT_555299 [Biscogniauxia sp. FL1348]